MPLLEISGLSIRFGGIVAKFRDPDGNGVCLMMWQSEHDALKAGRKA